MNNNKDMFPVALAGLLSFLAAIKNPLWSPGNDVEAARSAAMVGALFAAALVYAIPPRQSGDMILQAIFGESRRFSRVVTASMSFVWLILYLAAGFAIRHLLDSDKARYGGSFESLILYGAGIGFLTCAIGTLLMIPSAYAQSEFDSNKGLEGSDVGR